jgi:hypothetical protein
MPESYHLTLRCQCGATSWHHTAKSPGLPVEVNAAVVRGSSVLLPGESERSGDRLPQAARRVEHSDIKSHGGNAVGSQQKP